MNRTVPFLVLTALAACGGRPSRTADVRTAAADTLIRGRVAFADGTAPGQVRVFASFSREVLEFTDVTGAFELVVPAEAAAGTHVLFFAGPGFVSTMPCSAPGPIDLRPGRVHDVGTVVVSRGERVRGRVVGPDGRPAAGARVLAGATLQWRATAPSVFIGNGELLAARGGTLAGEQSATTDRDGEFEIAGVHDAPVALVAVDQEGSMSPVVVTVPSRPAELTTGEGGTLEGAITRDGAPVAAEVTARAATGPLTFSLRTGSDGRYRFEGVPPGAYTIAATGQSGSPARFPPATTPSGVTTGGTTRTDIDLPFLAEVAVRVERADGAAIAWQRVVIAAGKVTASRWRDLDPFAARGARGTRVAVSGGPGVRVWGDLPPGEYTACAAAGTAATAPRMCEQDTAVDDAPIACRSFTAVPGAERQEVRLEVPSP